MEEAAAVQRAALEAVDDVEPARLQERIAQRVESGSMAPGVLTLLSAAAVDEGVGHEAVVERAAGVQLIYEGLRLTRSLCHAEPWGDPDAAGAGRADGWQPPDPRTDGHGPRADGKSAAVAAADVDILVADILVARGFYLLAHTEAAGAAVGVVRSFGRDQTLAEGGDRSRDRNLEADVFELAVVAGTAAAGGGAPAHLREYVSGLPADGDLPTAEAVFPEAVLERLDGLVDPDAAPPEGARTSADP